MHILLIPLSRYPVSTPGTLQIHIVFDNSIRYQNHPKQIEHIHRYGTQMQCPYDDNFNPTDNTKVNTRDWDTILHCKKCKQRLTNYLGKAFIEIAPSYLRNDQRLYVAVCEIGGIALYSTYQPVITYSQPNLRCNAPEADTRIWLHAMHCVTTNGLNILINCFS